MNIVRMGRITLITIGWIGLTSFLLLLAYTAWVVKSEKNFFFKNSIPIQFGSFLLKTPSWWSLVDKNNSLLTFKRLDSKYQWYCTFSLIAQPLDLKKFLGHKKIVLDEALEIIKTNTNNLEIQALSGTGTENGEERIYYEIALIKSENDILLCESKSSVLNGSVEGPYFEEVINNIKRVS